MQSKYREYVQRGFLRWKHQESPTGSDNDGKQWERLSRNETNPCHKRHVCKYKESMNGAQIKKSIQRSVIWHKTHPLYEFSSLGLGNLQWRPLSQSISVLSAALMWSCDNGDLTESTRWHRFQIGQF